MNLIYTNSPKDFIPEGEAFLLQSESFNSLFLGLVNRLNEHGNPDEGEPFFYIFKEGNAVTGCAMRSAPNRGLILTDCSLEVLEQLTEDLKKKEIKLEGSIGPRESVLAFAKIWGQEYSEVMDQGVYECRQLIAPRETKGSLYKVTREDKDAFEIAVQFGGGFIADCFPKHREPLEEARKTVGRHVDHNGIYLWKNEDGKFVSMAGNHRDSKNAGSIGWVYTPSEYRGKGYGSMVTHGVTQEVFNKGKTLANLFTDMANPTSNSIYQKIGYKLIGHSYQIEFKQQG